MIEFEKHLTLHRPSNVDDPDALFRLLNAIGRATPDLAVVFPVHPRIRARLEGHPNVPPNVRCIEPLSYLDFIGLIAESEVVLTDSGASSRRLRSWAFHA
jgi:UDP-N-acetylglucosamine 2-epimerase (non-hydrolysing)